MNSDPRYVTAAAPGARSIDVTGTWNGSFTNIGATGISLPFVAVLEQKGTIVTGMSGGETSFNGSIQGTVSGIAPPSRERGTPALVGIA